jgi:hypothetical protein
METEMDDEMENNEMDKAETEVWLAWIDGKKDEAVEFVVPLIGCDVAEAAMAELGVDYDDFGKVNLCRKGSVYFDL